MKEDPKYNSKLINENLRFFLWRIFIHSINTIKGFIYAIVYPISSRNGYIIHSLRDVFIYTEAKENLGIIILVCLFQFKASRFKVAVVGIYMIVQKITIHLTLAKCLT